MNRAVVLVLACLSLVVIGDRALADEFVDELPVKVESDLAISGKSLCDVSAAPGTRIKKSGEGVAIVALKDGGKYTVSMDGPGTLYLIGMDDYSSVEVISKIGDGELVWVPPKNPEVRVGPTLKGKTDGNGTIRSGTDTEVSDRRAKAARSTTPGA